MHAGPKAFISYSWSSDEHQQWVISLATQMRENGVDVILDKWDLKEGNDAIAFMEQMVSDSTVKKVIVILDRVYAQKADGRQGGVGTETQIITPQIYKSVDQQKFVGVISEKDADGKPFLPVFYSSRIYIDLSDDSIFAENFDHLLRWVFDKPTFPKPALGRTPEFLSEQTVLLPTRSRASRAISLLRNASAGGSAALQDYLETFSDNLETLRLVEKKWR
jgi:TIR domain